MESIIISNGFYILYRDTHADLAAVTKARKDKWNIVDFLFQQVLFIYLLISYIENSLWINKTNTNIGNTGRLYYCFSPDLSVNHLLSVIFLLLLLSLTEKRFILGSKAIKRVMMSIIYIHSLPYYQLIMLIYNIGQLCLNIFDLSLILWFKWFKFSISSLYQFCMMFGWNQLPGLKLQHLKFWTWVMG